VQLRTLMTSAVVAASILAAAPAMAATPIITNQTNTSTTVYPVVDGYIDTITFGWKLDQQVTGLTLDVVDSTNTSVFSATLDPAATKYVWNGLGTGGSIVPVGAYYARVTADNGTDPIDSNNGPTFTVSPKKLTKLTFSKQVTAGGSMLAMAVGSCSKVARPGTRLGAGSVGYYSNTKCVKKGEDFAATLHSMKLPKAYQPGNVSISTYGAAVKAGSTMRVGLLFGGEWTIGSTKGWHAGNAVPAAQQLDSTGRLLWQAFARNGNRYDIKYFKVTYHYTALV